MGEEGLRCGCCDRPESACRLRRLTRVREIFGLPELLCSDCFGEWYGGGLTDPAAIKARVLARSLEQEASRR